MQDFQYNAMIDELDEKMLARCVDLLWPVLRYRYLKREDVRRIDLKERLNDMVASYVPGYGQQPTKGKNDLACMGKYVEAIRFYFDNGYLPVKKGSRAEKYAAYAREIMDGYKKSDDPLMEIEDLFGIYLCLSRKAYPNYGNKAVTPIDDIDLHVCEDDARLLEKIRIFPFEKVTPAVLKVVAKPEKQDARQKDFAFLNNALLLCGLIKVQDDLGMEANK